MMPVDSTSACSASRTARFGRQPGHFLRVLHPALAGAGVGVAGVGHEHAHAVAMEFVRDRRPPERRRSRFCV